MRRPSLRTLLAGGAAVFLALIGAYVLVIRPWHLTWGATDQEVRRGMPGDEIHSNPSFSATRAVTVEASPEQIWPWLLQMGYRRAGFYSYDWIDNDGVPSADRILSEYQGLKVGDRIPMSSNARAEVLEMDPHRAMLWVFRDEGGQWENATWAWGLYEIDSLKTRLVSRLRVSYQWTRPSIVPMLVTDAVELVMMRKCLLGIKRRAEALAEKSER